MRKAGLPSAALGAAFAPLLTVCSAVLARGTPATLSAMLGWLCQDNLEILYHHHMLLSLENFPSVFGFCRSLAPIIYNRVTPTTFVFGDMYWTLTHAMFGLSSGRGAYL